MIAKNGIIDDKIMPYGHNHQGHLNSQLKI